MDFITLVNAHGAHDRPKGRHVNWYCHHKPQERLVICMYQYGEVGILEVQLHHSIIQPQQLFEGSHALHLGSVGALPTRSIF